MSVPVNTRNVKIVCSTVPLLFGMIFSAEYDLEIEKKKKKISKVSYREEVLFIIYLLLLLYRFIL